MSVELEALSDLFLRELHAAFQPCHSPHEPRPVVFGEPFFAAEACELAAVADVPSGVVFRGRCPAGDDVFYAYGFVLVSVGAEDAESGSEAIGNGKEADEGPWSPSPDLQDPSPNLPRGGGDIAAATLGECSIAAATLGECSLSHGRGLGRGFPLPLLAFHSADVQRVVVTLSYCHGF